MRRPRLKKNRRLRKCLNCKALYTPDPGNWWHQKYCTKPACRLASKHAAQKHWSASEKGHNYFTGADNVKRVQQWRKSNPGYWKRHGTKPAIALQDFASSEVTEKKANTHGLVLQDIVSSQGPLLIGLIANLMGTTLQDSIAQTAQRFIVSGRDILGIVPATQTKGGSRDGRQTHSLSRASSPCSPAVPVGSISVWYGISTSAG